MFMLGRSSCEKSQHNVQWLGSVYADEFVKRDKWVGLVDILFLDNYGHVHSYVTHVLAPPLNNVPNFSSTAGGIASHPPTDHITNYFWLNCCRTWKGEEARSLSHGSQVELTESLGQVGHVRPQQSSALPSPTDGEIPEVSFG